MLSSTRRSRLHLSRILTLATLLSLCISSAVAEEEQKEAKGQAEITLVRLNFTTETRGASESVEINGRRIPDYRPTIIRVFPSTGVVLDEQGHVLTFLGYRWVDMQSHNPRVDILTSEGQKYKGKLIGIDQSIGVAVVLALEGKLTRTPVCLRCEIRDGATVVAPVAEGAGFPQFEETQILSVASLAGATESGGWAVTVSRQLPGVGEPILSLDHQVLGFVASQKPSSDDPMGVRTIVYPMSQLLNLAEKIIKIGGDILTGWLGVYLENFPSGKGVMITQVQEDSPAQRAGLLPQDILLKWNGKEIPDARKFIQLAQNTAIGSKVTLEVQRQGRTLTLTPVIGTRKPNETSGKFAFNFPEMIPMPRQRGDEVDTPPRVGMETVQLTPQLADFLQIPGQMGLLVLNVDHRMAAGQAGVRVGDIILSVDGERIFDPHVFASHIESRGWGGRLILRLLHKGAERTAIIHLPKFTNRKN